MIKTTYHVGYFKFDNLEDAEIFDKYLEVFSKE